MTGISVPQGGGALAGIGETFQPDLHTGTGHVAVPLPLPPGRGAVTPSLTLAYSSGSGNGPFGLGWSLDVPRVSRRTDRGVPRYDRTDVFVLSGAEELAPVPIGTATPADLPTGAVATRYRPRTEAGFARIVHVVGPGNDYWDVWSKDGLRSRYGTARPSDAAADWQDPAAIRNPQGGVFAWLLSTTTDAFGNRVAYAYRGDGGAQRYLSTVSYADHGDLTDPQYAVTVAVVYNDADHPRPDPFSERRAGFELRTTLRATRIEVTTLGAPDAPSTVVALGYADEQPGGAVTSGLSLLTSIDISGADPASGQTQALPPLTFGYRGWNPAARKYRSLPATLPTTPLGPGTELLDLFADGLPSVVQLDGVNQRYWRNRGNGAVDLPRQLRGAPPGTGFGAPGVQLSDFDADGRPEVAVTAGGRTSVWSLATPAAAGDRAAFEPLPRRVAAAPAEGYGDPQARLVDLDGDHVPDLLIGGATPLAALGDGNGGFGAPRPLRGAPPVLADLANPHVQLADMSGDGLTDLVEVYDGSVRYWPNLGHGRFGPPVRMADAPRFADAAIYDGVGFDPRRLLLGDVTGDGTADVVYVGDGVITVWINRSGNGFAPGVVVRGTPGVDSTTSIRLADVHGVGVSGILWSGVGSRGTWAFLDLTGGVKPYLMTTIDNHRGASTKLTWSTSTAYAVADREAGRPWRTTLPFPVHVIAAARTTDWFSGTVLTSGFSYHEGYWDPADREFRGFGRVERVDVLEPVTPAPAGVAAVEPLDPLTPSTALPTGFDAAAHGNLLANWSFDAAGSGRVTLTTTATAPQGSATAAAPSWQATNATAATTVTELVASDLPQGNGGRMLHVTTDGAGCGVRQQLPAGSGGRHGVVASVWVKLLRGTVTLAVAGGDPVPLDRVGQWCLVRAGGGSDGPGQVAVLAGTGGAELYLDHAWVAAPDVPAEPVDAPPSRTVTWFHLGPVGPAAGAWTNVSPIDSYWSGDPPLAVAVDSSHLPADLTRPVLREALRALRGRILRSELYADDGDPDRDGRPYEVHDSAFELAPVLDGRDAADPSWLAAPVITVRETVTRSTIWDRGDDPMTRLTLMGGYDDYGRPTASVDVGVPRGRDPRAGGEPCLATVTTTSYATKDDADGYRLDRVCRSARHQAIDPGSGAVLAFAAEAVAGSHVGDLRALDLTYYDGDEFVGLPLGQLGAHALPVRTEQLVLTPDLLTRIGQPAVPGGSPAAIPPYLDPTGAPPAAWPAEYPQAFRDTVTNAPAIRGPHAGYVWHAADGDLPAGYYAVTSRRRYDVHAPVAGRPPRGLTLVSRDPYGGDTTTEYDDLDLLPVAITDAAGLRTQAEYDYRVFKPTLVTDPNGNRRAATYTPLGLPATGAVLGKPGDASADTLDQPSETYSYDLQAWDASATDGDRQPTSVTTTRRVDHRWTLVQQENARRAASGSPPLSDAEIAAMFGPTETTDHPERFVRVVEFSDGLGRLLQTRTQADDLAVTDLGLPDDVGPAARAVTRDPATGQPAVVVSGWKRYDAKGHPIVVYDPFRDTGWQYVAPSADRLSGLSAARQHYDARGRTTVTVAADGTQTRSVPGIPADPSRPAVYDPSPWETWTYDANDEAGRTHPTSALDVVAQWDTPSSVVVDAYGRQVRTVRRGLANDVVTTLGYDVDGRLVTATDPLGRQAVANVYDLTGRAWLHWELDAGATRTVHDPAGGTIERRDDKGAVALIAYDASHRSVRLWASDSAGRPVTLRHATVYGDDPTESGLSASDAATANALGQVVALYDEAGRVTTTGYDLGGHPTSTVRRVVRPDLLLSTLPVPGSGPWAGTGYAVDWQPAAGQTLAAHGEPLLDGTDYRTDATFDALGRRTTMTAPVDATGGRAVLAFGYDRGGGATTVSVDGAAYVSQVAYDAHGRRSVALLGNGVLLRYRYDARSQRLRRIRAEHAAVTATGWTCDGPVLQDVSHRYDPGGNLVTLGDRTPGCGIAPTADTLDRRFAYDALDRLVSADGREAADALPAQPWIDVPRGSDPTSVRRYAETYTYDAVGNLLALAHATDASGTGAYTRAFATGVANRLASLTSGSVTVPYAYDARGNLVSEATNRFLEWDHADRLLTFRDQAGPQQPTVYAQYRYDSSGQRVLKVVRRISGPDLITVYIGPFERVLRGTVGGTLTAYDELRVSHAQAALAVVKRGAALPDDPMAAHPVTYQLADHLSSVTATLDADGSLLGREEYLPYGETSFGSFARKRYRFTAKERDEESGLGYHGARYYAPWLARWTAVDPAPRTDGAGAYVYAVGNPLRMVDRDGRADTPAQAPPATDNVKASGADIRKNANVGAKSAERQVELLESKGMTVEGSEVVVPGGRIDQITSKLGKGLRALEQKSLTAWKKGGWYRDVEGKLNLERVDAMIMKAVRQAQTHIEGLAEAKAANPELKLPTMENILITVRAPKEIVAQVRARAQAIAASMEGPRVGIGVIGEPAAAARGAKGGAGGFTTVEGAGGTALMIYAVYSTATHMKEAYDEGQRTGSSLPVVEQGAREAGGWLGSMAGGALAGAALGAAFGIEGGPLALVTGLAGGIVGGIVGTEGVNRGIDALHQTANDFKAGFDAFIKPMYSPSAVGPWGGW